jgi:hypothetical protein
MFVIKTKGSDKVPDYIQIRDNNFALVDYVKLSSIEKKLKEIIPKSYEKYIKIILSAEFGQIIKISEDE